MKTLNYILSRNTLLTIYKSFVRPHLDYGNILYYQPNDRSMNSTQESVKVSDVLAITAAIKRTSWSKSYNSLGRESLKSRRLFRHLF